MNGKNWFGSCKATLNALMEGTVQDEKLCKSLAATIRVNFMSITSHKCSMFRNKKKMCMK